MVYFFFLIGFVFSVSLEAPIPLFSVDNQTWYNVDFYEHVFKDDWDALSINKKNEAFQDFLATELVCFLATKKGFHNNPEIKKDLMLRKRALLINNAYEHLIARPLIHKNDFNINLKNLKYKARVYHLLIGFSGSDQDTGALLSKQQALALTDSLRNQIIFSVSEGLDIESSFSSFAIEYSIDPSVKTNKGLLGWVPWGQTVMSFQRPVFELEKGVVSSPILTEYGYHLVLKTDLVFSNYYYYTQKHYKDLAYKVSQNFLPVDSLRVLAANFDSLLIQQKGLVFNHQYLDSLVLFLEKKQLGEKMLGNKNVLINWLEDFSFKSSLFLYNERGFGKGWLINKLKQTPSSRIPLIKTKQDLRDLVISFVLQDGVLSFAKEEKIDTTVSFLRDWSNNYKNIIYSEYLSFLNSKASVIDSFVVFKKYKEGLYDNKYIKPKRVVFTEVRVFSDSLGFLLEEKLKKGVLFDSLVVEYSGAIREPISEGAKSPLGKALFLLAPGEVSSVIKNSDGSFSVARVESFLSEEPFTIEKMYSQIEQEIRREKQDSIRKNIFKNTVEELQPNIHYRVLGLNND